MIKAVFIDIDDTLVDSNREISEETKQAIKDCIKNKIKIILTSGRSRKEAIEYQENIKTSPYIISSNGASCYDSEKNIEIYNEKLDKESVLKLFRYSNKNGYKIRLNYKDKLVLNTAFYPDEKDKELPTEQLEEIIENEDIVQCVVSNPDFEKMKEFRKYFNKEFSDMQIVNESKRFKNENLKTSKNYYCDIASKKISKGKAVQKICEYLKIETDEIVTIGDGENDISMFNITKNSVAMKNAVESAKEKANYETLSNDENGVAKVLKYLLK